MTPGTMKAERQPPLSMNQPVIKAAQPTPRLPQTPLMPIAMPVPADLAPSTTMARPTGW